MRPNLVILYICNMKNAVRTFISILAALLASGCELFEYHPYSVHLYGRSNINTQTIAQLESMQWHAPYKFAFITDTQGANDETADALKSISARGDISFIIHGGDLTDFGLPKEFLWGRDQLESCGLPYITVIGNHDCQGNGEDTFDYLFGTENFSLNVGHVHIVGLNTVALEYDYSKPVPDFDFIERDQEAVEAINAVHPDSITYTIVAMHSRPYDEQFNNNVARPFNHYLMRYPGMDGSTGDGEALPRGFCINGHNHHTETLDIFGNGILYYQCANMAKREYLVFTITDNGYEYERVVF